MKSPEFKIQDPSYLLKYWYTRDGKPMYVPRSPLSRTDLLLLLYLSIPDKIDRKAAQRIQTGLKEIWEDSISLLTKGTALVTSNGKIVYQSAEDIGLNAESLTVLTQKVAITDRASNVERRFSLPKEHFQELPITGITLIAPDAIGHLAHKRTVGGGANYYFVAGSDFFEVDPHMKPLKKRISQLLSEKNLPPILAAGTILNTLLHDLSQKELQGREPHRYGV